MDIYICALLALFYGMKPEEQSIYFALFCYLNWAHARIMSFSGRRREGLQVISFLDDNTFLFVE